MSRLWTALLLAVFAAAPAGAASGANSFALVNQTGQDMRSVAIRRFGAPDWQALPVAPAAGKAGAVPFSDTECAFEIRADLAGAGTVVWRGVNLCEVKIVRLHRDAEGRTWADYD